MHQNLSDNSIFSSLDKVDNDKNRLDKAEYLDNVDNNQTRLDKTEKTAHLFS